MSKLIHVYMAHRLSGPLHDENIEAAGRLMAELADRLPIVPYGSWITLTRYWDESKREKGLAIDRMQISRCEELWLLGPEVSNGMRFETGYADEFNVPCFKLVSLTVEEIVEWFLIRRAALNTANGTGRRYRGQP